MIADLLYVGQAGWKGKADLIRINYIPPYIHNTFSCLCVVVC